MLAALVAALGLALRKQDSAGTANETQVRIGSVAPLTGPQSHLARTIATARNWRSMRSTPRA